MLNFIVDDVLNGFKDKDGGICGPFQNKALGFPETTGSKTEIASQLFSIINAGPRYRMLSLGAAPGEWAIRAERAHRKLYPSGDYGSINVEADIGHVIMIQNELIQHNCDLKYNAMIFGSVAANDGWSYFPIIEENDWGAFVTSFSEDMNGLDGKLKNFSPTRSKMRVIPAFSLKRLIYMCGDTVDFLHCDIQGGELDIFEENMHAMNDRVRFACLSIHSTKADSFLKELFEAKGWSSLAAVDGVYKYPPEGEECHEDGQLIFANPKQVNSW